MFDFSPMIDLSLIWAGIIAIAIFFYVLLDGFDLGIGLLFPFAEGDKERNQMMNSIAPFWDGNETWLVLGGSGLFAAFPLAYSILFPAFYIPLILMLLGLVFRGVAFEFRFKAKKNDRHVWDYAFHFGSLTATFCQGLILGSFVEGTVIEGRIFSGGHFDWLSPFSMMTGAALLFGYALLGSTWLIMKTEGRTQAWARKTAFYVLLYVAIFMGLVSLWIPFLEPRIFARWFSLPNLIYLSPVPVLTALGFIGLILSIIYKKEILPFILSIFLFSLGYFGLAISLWPWIVPYSVTIWQASADPNSLSLMLVGVAILLPVIIGYTCYVYYVFRGKAATYAGYHD